MLLKCITISLALCVFIVDPGFASPQWNNVEFETQNEKEDKSESILQILVLRKKSRDNKDTNQFHSAPTIDATYKETLNHSRSVPIQIYTSKRHLWVEQFLL